MINRIGIVALLGGLFVIVLLLAAALPCAAQSDSPAIYYQGRLTLGGEPANGWYDFEFRIYDEPTGGKMVSPAQSAGDVYVNEGVFALFLDFEDISGDEMRYLEIGVRPGGSDDSYTTLSPRQAINPVSLSNVDSQQTTDESWRLGVTVEGDSAYASVIGRLAGETADFRSNYDVTEIYFMLPAPAVQKTVTAARFYIVSRTGSYTGTASMALEVLDFAGNLQHTVSTANVDMQSAATGAWTSLSLSGDPDNVISSGEFLAFHFELSDIPGGDLDVRPIFEVEVN